MILASTRFASLLCVAVLCFAACKRKQEADESREARFIKLMNRGKNYLDQGESGKALEVYVAAERLMPTDPDVHLNLANAHLLAGHPAEAAREANQVIQLNSNSAAGWYVKGCAELRLSRFTEAVKALQTARNLDPGEPAASYQLGVAQAKLSHWDEAINALTDVVTFQPEHPSAHYQLSQALARAGRDAEARQEMEIHQQLALKNAGRALTPESLEKSKFTQARMAFVLEQPAKDGVPVRFVDDSARAFGNYATKISGPIAILDPNHTGTNCLFAFEGEGFRLYWNENAVFEPALDLFPAIPEARYTQLVAGDLQNDRFEDVIALSDKGTQIFKFATNGAAMDVGPYSQLQSLAASSGALVDLDFTGKLDLLAVTAPTNNARLLRLYRQFGPMLFTDISSTSGLPASLTNVRAVVVDDWPKDEMMDVIAARGSNAPLLMAKPRGAALAPTNVPNWPAGTIIATGDLNNDLITDLVVADGSTIRIAFQGNSELMKFTSDVANIREIALNDFDNDGWLDIWLVGEQLSAWRNTGSAGFKDASSQLGLLGLKGPFSEMHFADFDRDGDSDAIVSAVKGGLKYLRNEGGNANQQLKLRLAGNRSNASGLGVKVEVTSGGLRLMRTVQTLPVEIGVGKNTNLESMVVHWFNLAAANIDVPVDSKTELPVFELVLPEGSCPYMYAWDGEKFRFVTDILGAAPAGLPVAEGVYIEADPDEYAWVGDEQSFRPNEGNYTIQITEELREALYLDEAKLVVVDHEPGQEVHPTDKLVAHRPFPPSGLITLRNEIPLLRAMTLAGREVTSVLREQDGNRVSPERLRVPQQRGLAEPHGMVLDFGELPSARPLVLVLNGWLRFGGGMANINGSLDRSLPFPFPTLQVEVNGRWTNVDVTVGAPAGKTKTIVVDLAGKIPRGARRLKVESAFEIHWDRAALMERADGSGTHVMQVAPASADLHWRGFSEFEDLPWSWPLTPDYARLSPNPKWRITPAGWCTRYGETRELIARRDEGLLIMNGGDELTLKFPAENLPPKPAGSIREFFLYADGWDKDSDFHVRAGTTVEPLPWHGMNDQLYGSQARPAFPSDWLHEKYNTRWVEAKVLKRTAQ
jgi:tetratricopeptide (TPR) repeat protein